MLLKCFSAMLFNCSSDMLFKCSSAMLLSCSSYTAQLLCFLIVMLINCCALLLYAACLPLNLFACWTLEARCCYKWANVTTDVAFMHIPSHAYRVSHMVIRYFPALMQQIQRIINTVNTNCIYSRCWLHIFYIVRSQRIQLSIPDVWAGSWLLRW